MSNFSRSIVAEEFKKIQEEICNALELLDGKAVFSRDVWTHAEGGGGLSRVIQNGNLLEKGGVNFSEVWGDLPAPLKKEFGDDTSTFFATGVSIVLHPKSPMVPIIHMNIRYFETNNGKQWFGGGIDLTPHYIQPDLAKKFHTHLQTTCNAHHADYYPSFKQWADTYFYIPHRNETRGIGGIFFDHLQPKANQTWNDVFAFVCAVGRTFYPAYAEQCKATMQLAFTPEQKNWQLLRRGRYVEFNLVYDRGTKFGLQTGGRIESILMSLPEHASWKYNYTPEKNSAEQFTLDLLKQGIDWLA